MARTATRSERVRTQRQLESKAGRRGRPAPDGNLNEYEFNDCASVRQEKRSFFLASSAQVSGTITKRSIGDQAVQADHLMLIRTQYPQGDSTRVL
jgi:hypothetical protein